MSLSKRIRLIVAACVIAVLALIIVFVFITNAPKKTTTASTAPTLSATEYGVMLDSKSGEILQVFNGPVDKIAGTNSTNFVTFLKHDPALDGYPNMGIGGEVQIDGAAHAYAAYLQPSITLDDAVTYYNQRLQDGVKIELQSPDDPPYTVTSLERVVFMDMYARITTAIDAGELTKLSFAANGQPTVTYDTEVAAQYTAEQEALEAIEKLCQDFPALQSGNHDLCKPEYPGLVNNGGSNTPPLSEPYPGSSYLFNCASVDVVTTNWDEFSSQVETLLGGKLVRFEPKIDPLTYATPQPCDYYGAPAQDPFGE